MSENRASVSWAARVRNEIWKPFEYDKDVEVTCRFPQGTTHQNIYDLMKEIKIGPTNFEGIVTRPGWLVNFTLKNKNVAVKLVC